jgi:hypothetical protein
MPRRCRHCRDYNIPKDAPKTEHFCCVDHKVMWALAQVYKARVKAQSAVQKVRAKQKRAFYENDVKTRKPAAIREFNAYIRERDKGLPCISCGKPICSTDYAAGHYIPAGNNSLLRFDEINVNGQHNTDCNKHKSGDQVRYRKGLLAKYGEYEVLRLESTNGTIKRTAEDYKKIEIEYKNKRLELTRLAELEGML